MRFLHLADLHLGKTVHGISLIDSDDQKVWVDRFLELAGRTRPDAVVIAGDVYDRGLPPGKAAQLLSRMLTELAGMSIPTFMTAGNHDSVYHLSFLRTLLANQQIYISAPMDKSTELVHVTLKDQYGPVTFWLMPYMFPAMAAQALGDTEIHDYDTAVRRILQAQDVDFSQRNLIIAHQNVTADGQEAIRGGSESMVGGIGQVDYTAFDGFEYVALGHIHSSYSVGREAVRYAGTPLAYHFNETRQPAKGPLLVTLGEKGGELTIERQEIEPLHRMREIRGSYGTIREEMAATIRRNEYLKVTLTDRRITPEVSDYLHESASARGSTILELTSEYSPFSGDTDGPVRDTQGKSVEQLFAEFYTERNNGIEPGEADMDLMAFVGEMIRSAAEVHGEPDENDFRKVLDFVLNQEEGRE